MKILLLQRVQDHGWTQALEKRQRKEKRNHKRVEITEEGKNKENK